MKAGREGAEEGWRWRSGRGEYVSTSWSETSGGDEGRGRGGMERESDDKVEAGGDGVRGEERWEAGGRRGAG